LHHTLFDMGVLGLTSDHHLKVSELYVARSQAGQTVYGLAGRSLASPRPGQPAVDAEHIAWHDSQVFRGVAA
jgi:putative restriction endonuclease